MIKGPVKILTEKDRILEFLCIIQCVLRTGLNAETAVNAAFHDHPVVAELSLVVFILIAFNRNNAVRAGIDTKPACSAFFRYELKPAPKPFREHRFLFGIHLGHFLTEEVLDRYA